MSTEIVIDESAAETPEAHSAQIAAEAAEAAIAASNAASALANVAAAESIAENNSVVSEVVETTERVERNLEWVSEQVEVCFQNQIQTTTLLEEMTTKLLELSAMFAQIPPSIYSTQEPEALALSEENSPLTPGSLPESEVIAEEIPQNAVVVLPVVEAVKPQVPVRRKHNPL